MIDVLSYLGSNAYGLEVHVMTSWMEERDRLVAQTLAFVQEVAAAHPAPLMAAAEMRAAGTPASGRSDSEEAAATLNAAAAPAPVIAAPQPVPATRAARSSKPLATLVSERADIMQRVEAFRARQSRIIEEREAYCETVKAKIRTVLGNDSKDTRL
ncbi:hypothetical protein [Tardiphaga sp.]|uniref:hypothetical protein n=1 Tax=Tardiphaga sp. TaxID=1926292 RepID=UPI002602F33F|nr:hypothetical protein [Tardiphaga sp.]